MHNAAPFVRTNSRLMGRCERDHISSYMAKAVRLELVKQEIKTTFQMLRCPPPPSVQYNVGGAALVGPGSSTAVSNIVMGAVGVRGGARFEFPIISPIYGLWIFRVRGPDHANCKSGLLGLVGLIARLRTHTYIHTRTHDRTHKHTHAHEHF